MDLSSVVARCRANAAAMAQLRAIYASADRAAADAGLLCLRCGTCCKFDLSGERLLLTVAELALLTWDRPPGAGAGGGRCPYQIGRDCTAHGRRPLGCRTFFCRGRKKLVLRDAHEGLLRRIRRLHQTHCIPYAYGELGGLLLQLYSHK